MTVVRLMACFTIVLFWLAACSPAETQTEAPVPVQASSPQDLFTQRCISCHDGSVPKAAHQIEFQVIGADAIYRALTDGLMQTHVQDLSDEAVRGLALHLGGASPVKTPVARCATTAVEAARPAHQGWSLTLQGTRFVDAFGTSITRENVADLQVQWVFAYPGASRARSQPVIFGEAVLVGSQDGTVYALDLESGCAHWTFKADIEVRSAIAVNDTGERAYFGDIKGQVYAIDPRNGELQWKTLADPHPDVTLTGSPRLFEDRLYVPLSSKEWASAADPGYECCTFRGGVVAIDAASGEIQWTAYAIPQTPEPTGEKTALGSARYHPAGAPIWNSPTIDEQRRLLYVGTGEGYTSPASDYSDAVIAFDLDTGQMMWHYQSIAGDAWNMACYIGGGTNCPEENGPDLDIGAPPMLLHLDDDRSVVIGGQKSGDVFALKPEDGSLLWRRKVGRGGFAGGVHWGMAAIGETIYAPNADTVFTGRFTGERKPGLFALNAADGEILWYAKAPEVCAEQDKPACDPGFSAAVTATPEVVFAGAFDGHLRAYGAADGELLWDFNTHRYFDSVSGESAKGGSIEADGPVVHGKYVLVNSGYLFGDRMPGNALVAFALE